MRQILKKNAHRRGYLYFGLSLMIGWQAVLAENVDNRTLPLWTNYLSSKFSVNGPTQEEWSKKRGQVADDLVEEDLRKSYLAAVSAGDVARQKSVVEDLQANSPEDPQYLQWALDVEARARSLETPKSSKTKGQADGGDMKVGRLAVSGPEGLYLWEVNSLPTEMQEPIVQRVPQLKKERDVS